MYAHAQLVMYVCMYSCVNGEMYYYTTFLEVGTIFSYSNSDTRANSTNYSQAKKHTTLYVLMSVGFFFYLRAVELTHKTHTHKFNSPEGHE